MKTRHYPAFLWFLALGLPAMGDTIVLKDGSTLEGSVLREDADSYVIEVQVTKSIKDERVIPKADVASIQQAKPDLIAFEVIAPLTPTPDVLTSDEYAQRIRAVEKFLKDHPASSKATQAKAMLATLKAEANEVLAGGIKLNGKIVPPAEYRANAYDIDARIAAAKIKQLIDANRHLEALRAFSEFDRDFPNTSAHEELSPLINKVIRNYMAGINQSITTFDARTKERQIGLERMPTADRRATAEAITEENEALEKQLKAEKDAKIGWVTTHPFYKPSLEETMTFGKQELTRLAARTSAPRVDGGKAYRDALAKIQGAGDKAAISAALSEAKAAGVPQRYIATLEAAARAAGHTP